MMDNSVPPSAALEIRSPDGSSRSLRITETPYMVGRGEQVNHLHIPDDRLSRKCATITLEENRYYLEDRGNSGGVFVNGGKISRQALATGDVITFGAEIPYILIFNGSPAELSTIHKLVTRLEASGESDPSGGLERLNLLLEASRLLHSHLPLDTVLEAMLDRAITITDADRALLLESDASGSLQPRLGRRKGSLKLPSNSFTPSRTAVNAAIKQKSAIITQDLDLADNVLQNAQSIVDQRLLAVVAIPLYARPRANDGTSGDQSRESRFLGVMYLDSQRRAAFTGLDRQILDVIAIESASIIDNARMAKIEKEQQRVEQELNIARDIQQALLPHGFHDFPYASISGFNMPCHAVGGDYFDIFPIDGERVAFLVADVSGKGLGAALVTTMLQGAFTGVTTGADPERVFAHINTFLCERSAVGRHATLFFGSVDRAGNLEYVNAGHPSPLLVRRGAVRELFTEGALPLGLIPAVQYSTARATLEHGDTLVLFSDGITEAENQAQEFFGESRLKALLVEQHDAPLDLIKQNIVKAVERFTDGASQADDITILLVRYRIPE